MRFEETKWSDLAETAKKMLREAFGPTTTKVYCEDVFRDLRRSFEHIPTSQVTMWNRQSGVAKSLEGRDEKNILPVLTAQESTLQRLQKLKHKRLISTGIFTPPGNQAKARKAFEHGQCFDIGFADAELGVAPLVDMGPLLGKRKKDQNDKAPPKANGDRDTLPLFLLPATKETLRSTASSLAFVASLSDVASLEAVEQELGRTWLGQALHLGYCFLIKNEVWLFVGFCQFAALMWKLEAVQVAEGWEQVFFCESGAFGDSELRWFTVCELREGGAKGCITEMTVLHG